MWTADHISRRREAVDERGEQPEGQPNRLAMTTGSKRPRAEMGAREKQKRRKQHPARCLPLPNRKFNNSSSNRSNRSSAPAVTHTDTTAMVDNEALYDICHGNADFSSLSMRMMK